VASADPVHARYDETPYRDAAFPELDVSRLLGVAAVFGDAASDREVVRVLDLCCASGVHLREQARAHPDAHFTGVDFSRRAIEAGREQAARDGLANVDLRVADLRDFEVEPGAYHVVLCHGAFSWVPDEAKQRILAICRAGLRRDGVAAIAYLTYPGWKQPEAIRELLLSRVGGIDDPAERVRQSGLLLRVLHDGYAARAGDPQAASWKAVVERMQRASTNVFLHDELGVEHDPCYFLQFAEWAAESGLAYLAEADLGSMAAGLPGREASAALRELAPDFLEAQQWIDFLVNRTGRTSLLVRDDAPFERRLAPERLAGLCFSTEFCNTRPADAPAGTPDRFESLRGRTAHLDDPTGKRLVDRLAAAAPATLSLAALEKAEPGAPVAPALAALVSKGIVDPHLPIGADQARG